MTRWREDEIGKLVSADMRRQIRSQLARAIDENVIAQMGGNGSAAPIAAPAASPQPKRKYRNEPKWVNGLKFDSGLEARRYEELLNMERAGLIRDLAVHVPFGLDAHAPDGRAVRVASIELDFAYWRDGRIQVEDTKSPATRTDLYQLKRKLFEIQYGIPIIEIQAARPRTTGDQS